MLFDETAHIRPSDSPHGRRFKRLGAGRVWPFIEDGDLVKAVAWTSNPENLFSSIGRNLEDLHLPGLHHVHAVSRLSLSEQDLSLLQAQFKYAGLDALQGNLVEVLKVYNGLEVLAQHAHPRSRTRVDWK